MIRRVILIVLFAVFAGIAAWASVPDKCDSLIAEAQAALRDKEYVRALELLTEARVLAEEHQLPKHMFLALNNMGLTYYTLLDYGEALSNYLEAYKVVLAYPDSKMEMAVLNNIAILYSKENKPDKAEEYFRTAYHLATECGDSAKIGRYALNLAVTANKGADVETSEAYLKMAMPMISDEWEQYIAKILRIKNLVLLEKYDEAEQAANQILPQLTDDYYKEHKISVLLILCDIFEKKQEIDKAIDAALLALEEDANLEYKVEVYEVLYRLFKTTSDLERAYGYHHLYYAARDSLNMLKNQMLFESNRAKFEIQNYRKELAQNQEKIKTERIIYGIVLLFVILAVVFIVWMLRANLLKYKQRKFITELELDKEKTDKMLIEQQLKEKEILSLLEAERLKNEIESKNRKLTARALHLSTRNQLIEGILTSLSGNARFSDSPELSELLEKLKHDLNGTNSEWRNFLMHFEEVNHGFHAELRKRHPDLSPNDVRFLTYLYMNLSTDEIASLLNITPLASQRRKERIFRKMQLDENTSLHEYISTQ